MGQVADLTYPDAQMLATIFKVLSPFVVDTETLEAIWTLFGRSFSFIIAAEPEGGLYRIVTVSMRGANPQTAGALPDELTPHVATMREVETYVRQVQGELGTAFGLTVRRWK